MVLSMWQNFKLFIRTLIKLTVWLGICAVLLSIFVDSRFLSERIAGALSKVSGLKFTILGPARFTLISSGPGIEVRGILIEQPSGFKSTVSLIRIPRLNLRIDLVALLTGSVKLKEVSIYRPRVYAIVNENGENSLLALIKQLQVQNTPDYEKSNLKETNSSSTNFLSSTNSSSVMLNAGQNATQLSTNSTLSVIQSGIAQNATIAQNTQNATIKADTDTLEAGTNKTESFTSPDIDLQDRIEMKLYALLKPILPSLDKIEINKGRFYFESTKTEWYDVNDLNISFSITDQDDDKFPQLAELTIETDLKMPAEVVEQPDSPPINFTLDTKLSLPFALQDQEQGKLKLSSPKLSLNLYSDKYSSPKGSIFGRLRLGLDADLSLTDQSLNISKLEVNGDGLSAYGHINVYNLFTFTPLTIVELSVNNFSLTRWLGFTRKLPNGLQHTLNKAGGNVNALGVGSHFAFSSDNIKTPYVKISGLGIVPNFLKPSLYLSLNTDFVDANRVIPDLSPSEKQGGYKEPPPLTSLPPLPFFGPNSRVSDFGEFPFNILIFAKKAKVNLFDIDTIKVRIFPDMTKKLVALNAQVGNVYGGTGVVDLDLTKDVVIRAKLQNINTEPMTVLLSDVVNTKGRANLNFNGLLVGKVVTADADLQNVDPFKLVIIGGGDIKKQGNKSSFGDMELPFARLLVSAKNLRIENIKRILNLSGELTADIQGPFDIGGLTFNQFVIKKAKFNTPVLMDLEAQKFTKVENIDFETYSRGTFKSFEQERPLNMGLRGILNLQLERKGLSLDKMNLSLFNSTITGKFKAERLWGNRSLNDRGQVVNTDTVYDMSLGFKSNKLRDFLDGTGLNSGLGLAVPKNEKMLNNLDCSADINAKGEALKIKNMQGKLDLTPFKFDLEKKVLGSADANNKLAPKYDWKLSLSLGSFNFDDYREKSKPESENKTSEKPKAKPWNFTPLYENKIQASLNAEHLRIFKLDFNNLKADLSVADGRINLKPVSSKLYDGHFKLDLSSKVENNALVSALNINAEQVNVSRFMISLFEKEYATGKMFLNTNLSGVAKSMDDIPSGVSGPWNIQFKDGQYFTDPPNVNDTKKRKSSGTSFSLATASGAMTNGVIKTDNFKLNSGLLEMNGRATIDLNKRTIDTRINVIVIKGPTIPVTVTGSLSNPEVSVKGLQAVPTSVFQITKSVLTLPLRIFGYED
ncbi:AsmA-like C-terminal region-containing protein [Desulfovibrio litoralis]|uniref:AsmA-like C-terminal region n=1 Tax=Desulfovibrio litoralis DSM 11393 TaxID=1121455 RepID=A0A1M7T5U0_9BACT|nr:AsmA-like C-terminal region-containing protein [Desulfovibrio litoralis]SHN66110.1 AsmA-like C-terminal region [Desulfovibrio litoralis DSM 11393]